MKKSLLLSLIIFIKFILKGQDFSGNYDLNFENSTFFNHIVIPTGSNNKWQIGAPQKAVFTSAFSPTAVIVTDKISPYTINDTSIFIIKNTVGDGFVYHHTAILAGKYFVNSDSLTDFGKIEFSPNNGVTWIDLINTVTYSASIDWVIKPTLTGNSLGWKDFYVNIAQLGPIFNIHYGDTVLYKFSFITDNNQTNKDGIMYDDFHFEDYVESIPEIKNDHLISIFPNPVSDIVRIDELKNGFTPAIEMYDFNGRSVYTEKNFNGQICVKTFPNGPYFLKYSYGKFVVIKKIIIQH